MSEPHWIWQRDHVIPSDPAAGRHVLDEVLQEMDRLHWSPHDVFAVHLAMEEALMNAMKHGNQLAPNKRVIVRTRISAALVRLEIHDEGPGFDADTLPDPTDADHIECAGGRGVLLMRAFMSRVEFGAGGTTVVLEKRRDQPI